MLIAGAHLMAASPAAAQIYACVAEDGTRVYSDERCGPDAKVVDGITTRKPARNAPAARNAASRQTRPAAELELLSKACDGGDMKACKEWTLGGGPNLLRRKERQAELDCEAGSLSACEERYCRDGLSAQCRASVLRTARLAGETWYLRNEERGRPDGLARYEIRCVPEGAAQTSDVAVFCSALPGPERCRGADQQQAYSRLDQAAAQICSLN